MVRCTAGIGYYARPEWFVMALTGSALTSGQWYFVMGERARSTLSLFALPQPVVRWLGDMVAALLKKALRDSSEGLESEPVPIKARMVRNPPGPWLLFADTDKGPYLLNLHGRMWPRV